MKSQDSKTYYTGYSYFPDEEYGHYVGSVIDQKILDRLNKTVTVSYPQTYEIQCGTESKSINFPGDKTPNFTLWYDIPDGLYVIWRKITNGRTNRLVNHYSVGNFRNGYAHSVFAEYRTFHDNTNFAYGVFQPPNYNLPCLVTTRKYHNFGQLYKEVRVGYDNKVTFYKDEFICKTLFYEGEELLGMSEFKRGVPDGFYLTYCNGTSVSNGRFVYQDAGFYHFEKGQVRGDKSISEFWLRKQLEEKLGSCVNPTNSNYLTGEIIGYHYHDVNTIFTDYVLRYDDEGKLHGISEFYTTESEFPSWSDLSKKWQKEFKHQSSDDCKSILGHLCANNLTSTRDKIKYRYYLYGRETSEMYYQFLLKQVVEKESISLRELSNVIVSYV